MTKRRCTYRKQPTGAFRVGHWVASVAVVLAGAVAQAQVEPPVMESVAVISEGDRVSLRWSLPDQSFPEGGFTITRTGPGSAVSDWLVPSPLPPEESLVDADTYEAATTIYSPAFRTETDDEATAQLADLARAFFALDVAANPDLAVTLGILYHDEDVAEGQRLSYEVRTAAGLLVGTAAITVGSTGPLDPPSGLTATPTPEGIELIWDRPLESTLVFAYLVEAIDTIGNLVQLTEEWLPLPVLAEGPLAEPEPSYWLRDESRLPGEQVRYRVIGRDLFGRVTPPSEEALVAAVDSVVLPQPLIVDAEVGDRLITLHWAVAEDPRVVAIAVLRAEALDSEPELISALLPPDTTSWTDEGLRGGVDYHYYVAAFDGSGRAATGPIWTQRAVNPHPPGPPAGLVVEPAETSLLLSWTPPPEEDVGRYQVYAGRPDAPFGQMTLAGETVATSFVVPVPANTMFDVAFRVRAVNTSDVPGSPSEAVVGRPIDLTPPSAPLWLEVEAAHKAVLLSWIRDLDPDVESVRVLRSPAGGDAFTPITAWLASATVSHVDMDAAPGLVYDYALQAVDAVGNESDLSEVRRAAAWSLDAPAPVTGLTAAVLEAGGVRLVWDAADGVGWVVARLLGGSFVEISGLVTEPRFTDDRGRLGDRYLLVSVSAAGQLGEGVEVAAGER